MQQQKALNILRKPRDEFRQYRVKSIAVFGSVVREEARSDSDIDILVEFGLPMGLLFFFLSHT
jgi:hypothetical protein